MLLTPGHPCTVLRGCLQTRKLVEARKGRIASEDELGEVKLTLEQARNGWEVQREDLRHTIEKTNSETRVLRSEVEALTLSLENREAELARWSKSLGTGPEGDSSLEGGLAHAEQERANLRQEIRGLHNALEHKDLQMAHLTGHMDMLLAAINNSATLMVRRSGGHEKLFKHLKQKCKEEEQKRQRESEAAARTAELDRRVALEALRKRRIDDYGRKQVTADPDTAEAVGNVLASTMGVRFPESFYERLSIEPEPVPLGGSSDAKHTHSRETQPTAVHNSAQNIHSFLFHSMEAYPHAVMVKAYMPADANEQHARDEEVEAEITRQEVDAEMSVDLAPSPRSSQDAGEMSPKSSTSDYRHRGDAMRVSDDSTVRLLGGRAARVASAGSRRAGGLSSSLAGSSVSRLGPDPADVRASQSLSQSQRLPSGEMSAVLSSLQSLHASAHFPAPAQAEGGAMTLPHGIASGDQANELLSLLRDMRQEMREMDEQRQRDSDSMKMQISLVLEGNGELAESGRKQLRLGQEVSDMITDMRQMQVESKKPSTVARTRAHTSLLLQPPSHATVCCAQYSSDTDLMACARRATVCYALTHHALDHMYYPQHCRGTSAKTRSPVSGSVTASSLTRATLYLTRSMRLRRWTTTLSSEARPLVVLNRSRNSVLPAQLPHPARATR